MASFAAGERIAGRFLILRFLGAGGFAEVYAAVDEVTASPVALKILHGHLAADGKLAERFRRELSVTRSLEHPNIVRVHDLHQHGARPLFSMELLVGETLAARLGRGKLPLLEARDLLRQLGEALHAAHRQGVVHRDLKPQNVLLCADGRARILDFGVARAAGWARLTAMSTVLGTPGYVAPELFEGRGCDLRADLYSLGATYFEMLTGQRAFPSLDPADMLARAGRLPPSPRAVDASVPEEDDALVQRALEPDPERRFLDARQLLRALAGKAAPAPIAAPPQLSAGALDVLVLAESWKEKAAVRRVAERLGAEAPRRWWVRLHLSNQAVLVAGTSRASAEAVQAICEQEQVPCAVVPAKARSPLREAAARKAPYIGVASGGLVGALSAGLGASGAASVSSVLGAAGVASVATALGGATLVTALCALAAGWALAGLGEAPPLRSLPEGDIPVLRLLAGLARRTQRLRDELLSAPASQRGLAEELRAGAERLLTAGQALAAEAAAIPDPLASEDPDAVTLPPGALAGRDAAIQRLLEIAACLDAALADLRDGKLDAEAVSQAAARVREEIAASAGMIAAVATARAG